MVLMMRALACFLSGEWKLAAEKFDVAEAFFRDRCTAVYWDRALCHMMKSVSLMLMGRLGDLGETLPRVLREAETRGDLFEVTDLRIRLSHALALAQDDPQRASEELADSIGRWRTGAFDIQHWWALIAGTEIDLYAGRAHLAWEKWTTAYRALRRSMFLMAQYIRVESLQHRARAALGYVATGKASRADTRMLLGRARRDADRLAREDANWSRAARRPAACRRGCPDWL